MRNTFRFSCLSLRCMNNSSHLSTSPDPTDPHHHDRGSSRFDSDGAPPEVPALDRRVWRNRISNRGGHGMISRRADAACFVRNLTRPWAAADLTPAQCGDRLVLRCLACGEHTNEERGVAAYSWTRRSETAWGCRRCWPSKSSMTEAFLAAGLQAEGYQVYPVADAVGGISPVAHDRAIERMQAAGATPITAIQFGSELMRNWARDTSDLFRKVLQWYFPKRFALMKEGKI